VVTRRKKNQTLGYRPKQIIPWSLLSPETSLDEAKSPEAMRDLITGTFLFVAAMIRQTLEWIVVRRPLRGHDNTPFGQPTPGRHIGRPRVGRPQGAFGAISY
jgi:hypothetical protein